MKYLFLFIILLLFLQPCLANNITNITPRTAPQEFYGTILYSDGIEAPSNMLLIVTNQSGGVIGKFTTTDNGKYGGMYKPDKRLIVNGFVNDYLYFYANGIKVIPPQTLKFISGDITEFNIVIPASQRITPISTQNISQNITTTVTTNIPSTQIKTPSTTQTINQTLQQITDKTNENISTAVILACVIIIALLIFIIGYLLLHRKIKRNDDDNIGEFK